MYNFDDVITENKIVDKVNTSEFLKDLQSLEAINFTKYSEVTKMIDEKINLKIIHNKIKKELKK